MFKTFAVPRDRFLRIRLPHRLYPERSTRRSSLLFRHINRNKPDHIPQVISPDTTSRRVSHVRRFAESLVRARMSRPVSCVRWYRGLRSRTLTVRSDKTSWNPSIICTRLRSKQALMCARLSGFSRSPSIPTEDFARLIFIIFQDDNQRLEKRSRCAGVIAI